jgi:hypothetical protein
MKGVVFNLLEAFIAEGWGQETFEEIFSSCPLHDPGPHIGPGTYADADFMSIVGATVKRLGVPMPDAVRAFGKFCFPKLAAKATLFTEGHTHPKTFLLTVQNVIHVEVRKLMKGTVLPDFQYEDTGPDRLRMIYTSKRQLCWFAEGLIDGAGDYFGVQAHQHQSECTHEGGERCVFELRFGAGQAAVK